MKDIDARDSRAPPLDLDRHRRQRNTRTIAAGIALVDLSLLLFVALVGATPGLYALTGITAAGFVVLAVRAPRMRVELASALLVALQLGTLVASIPVMGQLAATPYYFGITLLIASATMRPRGVLFTGIATILALASTAFFVAGGAERPMLASGILANAASVCVITSIVAWLQVTSTQRTLRAALQAEERMAESEGRYRLIADHTSDLVALTDATGLFLYASPSFARVLGVEPSSLVGGNHPELLEPDDVLRRRAQWEATLHSGSSRDTYRVRRSDGTTLWMEVVLNAVPAPGGQVMVSTARDVTLQRALTERLQQSQKMDALGRLAGGAAHDFNNVLAIIQACSELLLKQLPADHASRALVEEMLRAEKRAASLTRQMMAFARREKLPAQRLDVARTLNGISELLPRLLSKNITLRVDLAPTLWDVFAAPVEIEQILMNLSVNARDAMPSGGALVILAVNRTIRNEGESTAAPGDYVELTLSDTGTGMSDDVKRHLFEPFFTTKENGTGLGLATCYALATRLGGTIEVESTAGVGTTFRVLLRRAEADPAKDGAASKGRVEPDSGMSRAT